MVLKFHETELNLSESQNHHAFSKDSDSLAYVDSDGEFVQTNHYKLDRQKVRSPINLQEQLSVDTRDKKKVGECQPYCRGF